MLDHLRLRRLAACGALVAAAAAPAAASAAYSPGSPYQVGTAVEYWTNESLFDATEGPSSGDANHTEHDRQLSVTGAAAASSSGWPLTASPFPPPMTACTGGCADADSVAAGRSDVAAGTLETYARTWAWAWGGHTSHAGGRTVVNVDDTITVSEDTTVVLKGRFVGTAARTDDPDRSQPDASLSAMIRFGLCGSEGCPEDMGWSRSLRPWDATPESVDETFSVPVALPAGRSAFAAELEAVADALGEQDGGSNARADGYDTGDGDRLEFEIVVPDHVAVSSGSGKLPIVGGLPPQEDDTTAPAVEVPSGVTVDAVQPGGAVVTYAAKANDETDPAPSLVCSPKSGSLFAVGATTVTCVGTDAAGNSATKTFVVTVRGVDAQLAALRTLIGQFPKSVQAQLLPHLKPKCNSMASLRHAIANLERRGELSEAQAGELLLHVNRIAGALGC